MEPVFLTVDEILEIHAQQIELYGGSDGVRDSGGLESAVATPMASFGGEFLHSTIPSMAAAYLFHLVRITRSWTATSERLPTPRLLSC